MINVQCADHAAFFSKSSECRQRNKMNDYNARLRQERLTQLIQTIRETLPNFTPGRTDEPAPGQPPLPQYSPPVLRPPLQPARALNVQLGINNPGVNQDIPAPHLQIFYINDNVMQDPNVYERPGGGRGHGLSRGRGHRGNRGASYRYVPYGPPLHQPNLPAYQMPLYDPRAFQPGLYFPGPPYNIYDGHYGPYY